ncbi:MAG: DUF882 domain-containing protein, partial [Pseudomonadota bacterium]
KERATITFKRNGKYDQAGLRKINRFLRDWRRGESTKMDPQLLDILWEAYKEVGSREYIHVVSAYRSPATNAMLRKTRGGQARKSQHMLGKAIDFFIPGVSANRLREIGFKLQGGGVGFYPRSATPFVHYDTGNVRAWPRMSRGQLTKLFPRGGTLHLPPDGKPLPGYQQALADYKSRKARGQATINRGSRGGQRSSGNLLANLFNRGGADEEEDTAAASAPSRAQTRRAAPPPQTPGTQLASLSMSRMPRPEIAPRGVRSTGVPVVVPVPQANLPEPAAPVPTAEPVTPPAPAQPEPAPAPEVATSLVASIPLEQMPVPDRRPAVLIARADPAQLARERRTAEELEEALNAANNGAGTEVALRSTVATDDTGAQRQAILAALTGTTERPVTPALAPIPLPSAVPQRPQTQLAYAPPAPAPLPAPTPVVAPEPASTELAALQDQTPEPPRSIEVKAGRLPVPALRAREQQVESDLIVAALAPEQAVPTPKDTRVDPTSVSTTSPTARIDAVPAPVDPSSRFGAMVTTLASLNSRVATARPDFIKNAQRAAPDAVYTRGFQREPLPQETQRFTGNAVSFLSVAKFETVSGGGQPLQIQIPATN